MHDGAPLRTAARGGARRHWALDRLASLGMDRAAGVAHLRKRREAWLREDVDAYLSLFDENFAFSANGVELINGRHALENAVHRSYLRYRPLAWEFHEIAVHGSTVLSEWTVTMEERATKTVRSLRAMSVCEIQDGLTVWQREYRLTAGADAPPPV